MQGFEKAKRHMEQSMLAYSDKVREIQRHRLSLPTPCLSNEEHYSVNRLFVKAKMAALDNNSFSDYATKSVSSSVSGDRFPELINSEYEPLIHMRYAGGQRKMTYHGKELEKRMFNPAAIRHHSVTVNGSHHFESFNKQRSRKMCTISPPDSTMLSAAHSTRTDSAYDSMCESDSEEIAHKISPLPKLTDANDNFSECNVQITDFPNIEREKEEMLKFKINENPNPEKFFIKRRRVQRQQMASLEKQNVDAEKDYDRLAKKLETQRKKAKKNMERKRKASKHQQQQDFETDSQEDSQPPPIVDEKREVCQSFRYGVAMEELKKKPFPRKLSKRDLVCRVALENGRIINTLGPAVLNTLSINEYEFPSSSIKIVKNKFEPKDSETEKESVLISRQTSINGNERNYSRQTSSRQTSVNAKDRTISRQGSFNANDRTLSRQTSLNIVSTSLPNVAASQSGIEC